ncbi:MAG: CHASE2 domain-containing protein, partial [Bacteroidia bacterium]|nr:CHASE2 domain-containing protein [Bacteroidia bacterium]
VKHTDRFLIAQAINKVQEQHPKVVGLDIVFKDLKNPFVDSILKNTLYKYSNIITSYYLENDSIVSNHNYFKSDNNIEGFINMNLSNQDAVIRNFIGVKDNNNLSFATQIAKKSGKLKEKNISKLDEQIPVKYFGEIDNFITFDIDELLELESIPVMKDAIVVFGYLGTPTGNIFDIEDKHFTPLNDKFTGRSTPDMFGVVIHANIIKMLTNNSFVKKIPKTIIYLIAIVCSFFTILFGMRLYKRSSLAYDILIKFIQLIISVAILYMALLLLRLNVYIFITPIVVLSLFGLEMIDFYVYLLDYLKKRFKWDSYLLD